MRSLATKVFLGFTAPLFAVVVIGVLMNRAFLEMAATSAWVRHTDRAISLAQSIGGAVLRAEASARGYMLTESDAFLRNYVDSRAECARLAVELAHHVADNPPQVARVEEAASSFRAWDEHVESPLLEARRTVGADELAVRVRARVSIASNERVHQLLKEITETEQSLLSLRMHASEAALRRSQLMMLSGSVVVALAAVAAALWLSRDIASRLGAVATAAERLSRGELGARSSVGGSDEIGRMAQVFDSMAETVEDRDRERERYRALSEMLQACVSSEEAYAVMGRSGPSLFPGVRGTLFMINASRNVFSAVASFGAQTAEDGVFELEDCWAIRRGKPHSVADTSTEMCCMHVGASPPRAYHCQPLVAQGETVGVLHLAEDEDKNQVQHTALASLVQRGTIETVGEQLGMTTGNLRLRERLRNQSIRDPLTALFNRRYFDETMARELARSTRVKRSLGLMLIDVDHFKRFNDTNGHEAGDLVLRELASLLRSEFRASDFACRFGGEEFVVVLLDAGIEDVARRAGALREKIKSLRVVLAGQSLGAISASIGIAAYPVHGDAVGALVRAADSALYRAKSGGRDRIEIASVDSPPRGSSTLPNCG